ncbi:MAG: hypothetical protein P1P71_07890 [Anaerosomatales bacterium]|nr:hypothetical protein [Anaerosomatales bacterium]
MSDQDFFFDDDEAQADKPAAKSAAKPAGAKARASAPRTKTAAAPAGAQSVTMSVAGLIGVVALLVGIIIGILIPTGSPQVTSPSVGVPSMGTGGTQAPPLSEQELQGEMPPGHPPIDDMTGGEATDTAAPEGESE